MSLNRIAKPVETGIKVHRPASRTSCERFVHAPVAWVARAQACKGFMAVPVALVVWYRHSVTREKSFTVSNTAAAAFGLDRKQKAAGLRSLAEAGLISVENASGQSPVVTLVWEPGK